MLQAEARWIKIFSKRLGKGLKKFCARPLTGSMHKQDIQKIVSAAHETADSIVGARAWKTAEDASAMHDVIFWDMVAKRLPNTNIADLLYMLD
ncbi:hypothetical protein [Paraburkholderia dipogonis]|nr:hypothetical protein [Paraburkholderia dipogonis]